MAQCAEGQAADWANSICVRPVGAFSAIDCNVMRGNSSLFYLSSTMELIVFRFDCGYEVSCSSAIARFGCRIAHSVSAAKS